jgi:chaperonin GroES
MFMSYLEALMGHPQLPGPKLLHHHPRTCSQVNEGLVIAVGPGRRTKDGELLPVGVKEGDRVMLPEYGGSAVKLGGSDAPE